MTGLVRASGTTLIADGKPFFARGVNCYFLSFVSRATQLGILADAAECGVNVIRTWAFHETYRRAGTGHSPCFQYLEGGRIHFNDGPAGLERLDSLIASATEAGIRLILPLVNQWPDFGGIHFYLQALNLPDEPAVFFRSPHAQNACLRWIEHVVTRHNTLTGRAYADEPAILAWELINEPRCPVPQGSETLLHWADMMSSAIKTLDRNHLVMAGDEGFFQRRSRSHLYDGRYGVDTEALLRLPSIDAGTFHLYPEHWALSPGPGADRWIAAHLELSSRVGKPMLLEEFGSTSRKRALHYRRWIRLMQNGGAGALLWMLGSEVAEAANYRDSYTLSAARLAEHLRQA